MDLRGVLVRHTATYHNRNTKWLYFKAMFSKNIGKAMIGNVFPWKKKVLQRHFRIKVLKSEKLTAKKICEQKQIFYMMVVTMHLLSHPVVKQVQ